MSMLYDKGKIDGALIIAPKGVVGTWYNQGVAYTFTKTCRECDCIMAIKYYKKNKKKN